MPANDKQVGGSHYKTEGDIPEHWDLAIMYNWDPFQYQITKYVMRWKYKNGLQDLQKAAHFLEKYIEAHKHYLKLQPEVLEPVPKVLENVKPTGWMGFTFEGADAAGFWYTCEKCKTRVQAVQYQPPWDLHDPFKCN